jgi:hypothetical protein
MQTDDIFTYGEETNPQLEIRNPKFRFLESRKICTCLLASLRFGGAGRRQGIQ